MSRGNEPTHYPQDKNHQAEIHRPEPTTLIPVETVRNPDGQGSSQALQPEDDDEDADQRAA